MSYMSSKYQEFDPYWISMENNLQLIELSNITKGFICNKL